MEHAIRLRVTVREDHTVLLPDEVPPGDAELIVLIPGSPDVESASRKAIRASLFGRLRGRATIADDFDAPLPESVLGDFEGS